MVLFGGLLHVGRRLVVESLFLFRRQIPHLLRWRSGPQLAAPDSHIPPNDGTGGDKTLRLHPRSGIQNCSHANEAAVFNRRTANVSSVANCNAVTDHGVVLHGRDDAPILHVRIRADVDPPPLAVPSQLRSFCDDRSSRERDRHVSSAARPWPIPLLQRSALSTEPYQTDEPGPIRTVPISAEHGAM